MQADPVKPKLKPPGTKRLKLKYDGPLSNAAFKFSLRRYTEVLVFRDVCPGYRIRPATDKERGMKMSKEVMKLRDFEAGAYTRPLLTST